ncbi:MAG: hypothetical protein IJT98_10880 [Prevotella sp.]|nr:hypothetical protein [Prevotella sp.]
MLKNTRYIRCLRLWLYCCLFGALLSSCGDLFQFEGAPEPAAEMELDRHDLALMVGDRFTLTPIFTPDTLHNKALYWISDHNDVVTFDDNQLVALTEGEAVVTAISVETRQYDTCHVVVFRPWEVNAGEYAYDMVLYANATLGGKPVVEGRQFVGAFCGKELRGVGQMRQQQDISYMVLRIYSHFSPYTPYGGLNPQDPLYPYDGERDAEQFVLRLYDRDTHTFYQLPNTITFDGEAHGTLSNLYPLEF